MKTRIKIHEQAPEAIEAMLSLEKYLSSTGFDKKLAALIKISASLINGCRYCIDMHCDEARKLGESVNRIDSLHTWRESQLYNDIERAALELTEQMTQISINGVDQAVYDRALVQLGEKKLAQCIMVIVTINAWNRIAITTRMHYKKQ